MGRYSVIHHRIHLPDIFRGYFSQALDHNEICYLVQGSSNSPTKLAVSAYACIRQNRKLFYTSSYGQKRAYFLENALCRIDWSFWLQSYCAMLDYLNIIWVFKKWWTLPAIETKSAWHSYWLSKMACGFRFVIHKNFEAFKLHSINVFKTVLKGPKTDCMFCMHFKVIHSTQAYFYWDSKWSTVYKKNLPWFGN